MHGVVESSRWDYSDVRYCDAMKWLHTLQQEGKIKELGLTNFDTEYMAKIVEDCAIPVVSNQVRQRSTETLSRFELTFRPPYPETDL